MNAPTGLGSQPQRPDMAVAVRKRGTAGSPEPQQLLPAVPGKSQRVPARRIEQTLDREGRSFVTRVAPQEKSTSSTHQSTPVFDRALARDGSVESTDKAVYAAIASFVDPTTGRSPSLTAILAGHVRPADVPTRKRLAECVGKTTHTVDRCIKRLEAMGAIRVVRQVHPDNPKVHVPSVYELLPYQPRPAHPPQVVVPGPRNRLPISPTKRARIMVRDGHQCQKCGALEDLTIDHIQHWSRGGTNADDNLRVLCRSCNSQRKDGVLEGLDA